jgi:DNA-binding transcriptional ArsR family regulator
LTMTDLDESTMQLSKFVFGSNHMLALMLEIANADAGAFSIPILTERTGLPASTVHHHLARLKGAGLIRQVKRVPGERVVTFLRVENRIWDGVKDLDAGKLARA